MSDLLDVLPEEHRDAGSAEIFAPIAQGFARQSGKGSGTSCSTATTPYLESSATAMFVYGRPAASTGMARRQSLRPRSAVGWNALGTQINNIGQIENVCVGTGVSYEPAYYYNPTCIPTPPTATVPS